MAKVADETTGSVADEGGAQDVVSEVGNTISGGEDGAMVWDDEGRLIGMASPQAEANARAVQTDPLTRAIDHLREMDLEPLRLWTVKAPKEVGGIVMAVFLQGPGEIVMVHQLPSGKFVVFHKAGE